VTDDAIPDSTEFVRSRDPDRYLADLFAPAALRPRLFALHAFAIEVSDIRRKVSQPMLGEIRLKWWETAIRGEHGGNPLAVAVAETIRDFNLPLTAFDNLLRARIFDLYDDPMPTLNDLEGYAGDTESTLMQLGALVLAGGRDAGTAEVAGLAGVAVAVTRLLRALPRHAAEGQAFLPQDALDRHGGVPGGVMAPASAAAVGATAADLRALARRRLDEARAAFGSAHEVALPALLPAAMVPLYLDRMERPGFEPLREPVDVAPVRRQWTLWRAARNGRF
jgi:phytoene synthase